ncbi:MAG: alpha/beta hydrolase [Puia sp.]|nr:alpha/beta hydrolase [Puia sp.]
MNKFSAIILLLLFTVAVNAQQKVIPLYPGVAPGSESWTWSETENADNMYHSNAIFNISKPTLTVYPPDSGHPPTGTAVIVCPGGGFHSLSIMQEGYAVVKWLQSKGITAFLLKYRLMHVEGGDPYKQEIADRTRKGADADRLTVANMAIADGRQALTYVRAHAAEYGIDPKRIGIIGFSAGGVISAATAYNYTPENRPDFVGFIYGGGLPPEMQNKIPADAPPLFIAAATNDTYNLEMAAVSLYSSWVTAKHTAELHIYAQGGHGFGLNKQGLPTDTWTDRFTDWMALQGFLKH